MDKLQISGRLRGALRLIMPQALNIAQRYGSDFPSLQRDGLCARCHRDWPDSPDFLPQWNELLARNPDLPRFCTPAWLSAVVDQCVPAGQFRLITVHRGDQLLAVLPLAFNTKSMLETPGVWLTDFYPVMQPDAADDCWAIILELLHSLWDWSVGGLVLHYLRSDLPARQAIENAARKFGFKYEQRVVNQSVHIPLAATWEAYLASLDAHERKELKRKIRNAQTKYSARLLKVTEPDQIKTALERALSAMREAASMKADLSDELLTPFLRRALPRMNESGDFYLNELWLNERPAAWLFALPSPQGPMIYNTSYVYSVRSLSPGVVAFGLAIQEAIKEGYPRFDLLRGSNEYKARLAGVSVDMLRITLRPATR
jgi:CelD/BcsL family acetyltransferase involved in cellulose biosynthesis